MSDERDRARVISEYADDLIARRASERPGTEPGTESDLARMLEVTRALTEIEFETPPGLTTELLAAAREEKTSKERTRWAGALGRSFTGIVRLLHARGSRRLRRPVGAFIAVAVIVTVFFVKRDPAVSASELLTKSARAEAVKLEPPGLVARRTFTIEARQIADRKPLKTQHVELWVNPNARIKARRLFDDRQHLLGGEWTEPDGSRIVYERGKPPRTERPSDSKPLTLDAMWRWEPSAEDFSRLVGDVGRVHARTTPEGFELSIDEASAPLAHVELSLDRDHFPVAQRVILREGGQAIEVRTRRTAAEVLPESGVAHTSFEAELELRPPSATSALSTAPRETPAPSVPARPPLTEQAMDGLELKVWYRLHQLAPCLAGAVDPRRTGGRLHVSVLVGSEVCRAEANMQFASLATEPNVSIDVTVVATQPAAQTAGSTTADFNSDDVLATIPVYRALYDFHARQALRHSGSTGDVDAVVNPLVRQVVLWARDRSARRVATSRELQQLSERWSSDRLKPLGLDAASMWQSMVRDQARTLAEDSEALLGQLEPVFDARPTSEKPTGEAVRTLDDARRVIHELPPTVESNDTAIQQLFAPVKAGDRNRPAAQPAPLIEAMRVIAQRARVLTGTWSLDR